MLLSFLYPLMEKYYVMVVSIRPQIGYGIQFQYVLQKQRDIQSRVKKKNKNIKDERKKSVLVTCGAQFIQLKNVKQLLVYSPKYIPKQQSLLSVLKTETTDISNLRLGQFINLILTLSILKMLIATTVWIAVGFSSLEIII